MANLKDIKSRMVAIKKTSSITKAMYNISVSKISNSTKTYFNNVEFMAKLEELTQNAANTANASHPLLSMPERDRRLYIIITSDKGLAGGYHNQLFKKLDEEFKKLKEKFYCLIIGKKGFTQAKKRTWDMVNENIVANRDDLTTMVLSDYSLLIKEYIINNVVDKVYIVYNHYQSSAKFDCQIDMILPLELAQDEKMGGEYIYDAKPDEVLTKIANLYIESKMYCSLADAKLSEHSSRMIAMKNATDNADEIVKKLTIIYNQARQQAITNELIDVINGASVEG